MTAWRSFLRFAASLCRGLAFLPLIFGAAFSFLADWLDHQAAPPR